MYNATIKTEVSDEDVQHVADNLRPEEIAEVMATSGSSPFEAVRRSVDSSMECFGVWKEDQLLGMSGVRRATVLSSVGCPWLLTTNEMKKNPRILLHYGKMFTQKWIEEDFNTLVNFVDTRYKGSLRWAKHVGFTVDEAAPYGPYEMPFHRIIMRK